MCRFRENERMLLPSNRDVCQLVLRPSPPPPFPPLIPTVLPECVVCDVALVLPWSSYVQEERRTSIPPLPPSVPPPLPSATNKNGVSNVTPNFAPPFSPMSSSRNVRVVGVAGD